MMKNRNINYQQGSGSFPNPVGIGLRGPHYREIDESKPNIGWLEVHPENYFGGGIHRHFLEKLRKDYEVSFHSVGISLGSAHGVDKTHLQRIKELADIFEPFQMSDHASWSASGNAHLNDLLPLPYTEETLETLCRNIETVQDFFGRSILVENPSTYMAFAENDMEEYELMNELSVRTGCGILLDCNNIFVQSHNHSFDPFHYISQINPEFVGEMHLAGHSERDLGEETILIDTHSKPVKKDVWDLYRHAIGHLGETLTLIEWDVDIPPLQTLLDEADKARQIIKDRSVSIEETKNMYSTKSELPDDIKSRHIEGIRA